MAGNGAYCKERKRTYLVHAIRLVTLGGFSLTTMAGVVEEEGISWLSAADEPMHCGRLWM